MRLSVTAVMLACASCVIAQTQVATPQAPTPLPARKAGIRRATGAPASAKPAVDVPPTTPVVTLQGVCKERQAKSPCKTVITREELDKFVNAFSPDASESARGGVAVQYARTLAFSTLAEQQGFDKNPVLAKELEVQVKLIRMRILASAFLQNLQEHTPSVTDPEIQKYYDDHRERYEQASVRRLSVPVTVPTENGRPLDPAAIKSEMEEVRNRAVAGEDFNQLQVDAYKHLHIQATPPPMNPMTLRRTTLQGDEAKAFDLKPGEVSEVLGLPAAFVIFKLESKDAPPIAIVRQEIENALRVGRMQNEVSKLDKTVSAQFNLEYLGMSSQPDLFGPAALRPATIRPAASRASVRRPAPGATRP
jgi:hypothetical protein